MEHPQGKTRRLTVLDLPNEILWQIFQSFQHRGLKEKDMISWAFSRPLEEDIIRRQAIQSARLVCRHFNRVASPLLCSIFRVTLDQESLDNVVKILQQPLIASGVRGIEVGLRYRPMQLATDLRKFTDHLMRRMEGFVLQCDYLTEFCESDVVCAGPPNDNIPVRVYREALNNAGLIECAWASFRTEPHRQHSDTSPDNPKTLMYKEILHRAHEEYRQKHEEQVRLIKSGSFVNILTSCIRQLQRVPALAFRDSSNRIRGNPTIQFNDVNKLSRYLTTPQSWRSIEFLGDGADLLPARILFELPVALHKAGSPADEIYVGCFPLQGGFSMILPPVQGSLSPKLWSDFRTACQNLRVFSFGRGGFSKDIRNNHPTSEDQFYIDQYLGANLSGMNLEFVYLSLYSFGLYDGRTTREDYPCLGSILRTIEWPRARDVTVMDVAMDQNDLESFCAGLGYSLKKLRMCSIQLQSGSYAGMVETLREKVRHRCSEGDCSVRFSDLTGGEFGKKKIEPLLMDDFFDTPEEHPMLMLAEKYVSGYSILNPFSKDQDVDFQP